MPLPSSCDQNFLDPNCWKEATVTKSLKNMVGNNLGNGGSKTARNCRECSLHRVEKLRNLTNVPLLFGRQFIVNSPSTKRNRGTLRDNV